jgi:hypothetical protein
VRFLLTAQLAEEARAFRLRAGCGDCFFWDSRRGECRHGWPDEGQRSWPLGGDLAASAQPVDTEPDGVREVAFCKEFELR